MKILELFSGIGAVSVAVHQSHQVACSIDINQIAMQVFQANFETPVWIQEISSISNQQLQEFGAHLWWMSPPCQPYTRRGLRKDTDDARSAGILRIIDAIGTVGPDHIALENVVGFENSETHRRLINTLRQNGYQYCSIQLCSTDLGVPNIRPRFFLIASKRFAPTLEPPDKITVSNPLFDFLQPDKKLHDELKVDELNLRQYHEAVNIVQPHYRTSRCFTSAYGRSNVFSGSYLETETGFRRFSPREIARLLGFPDSFVFPANLSTQQLWKLLGNAVSIPCVKYVLSRFDEAPD